jgi:hypothetical protein
MEAVLEERKHLLDMRVPRVALEDFGTETPERILLSETRSGTILMHPFADGNKFVSKRFRCDDRDLESARTKHFVYQMYGAGTPDAISLTHNVASRNIVAFRIAQTLAQLGDAPDTVPVVQSWAIVPRADMNKHVPVEIFMEAAPGRAMAEYTKLPGELNLFQKAELARQATWLHINDSITGEEDRHLNNFFAEFSENGCLIKGVDNDECLRETNTQISLDGIRTARGPRCYPPYIDREMYNAIMALNINHLRAIMRNSGRDPDLAPFNRELAAMSERTEALKAMAERRQQDAHVLEGRVAWRDESVLGTMDETNSHYGLFVSNTKEFREDNASSGCDSSTCGGSSDDGAPVPKLTSEQAANGMELYRRLRERMDEERMEQERLRVERQGMRQ